VPATTIKTEAHRIIEQLPDDASWEDLIYRLYVRQSIEAGLLDSEACRVESGAEVVSPLGCPNNRCLDEQCQARVARDVRLNCAKFGSLCSRDGGPNHPRTQQLSTMPYLGATAPEYDDETIRELVEQSYRIVYRVRADRVDILSVVHGARPLPSEVPGNGS
jgi:hypothetical protein